MEDSYIQNSVFLFLYHDLPADETIEISEIIVATPELRQMFQWYSRAKAQIPKALFNPSPLAVERVLSYSAQTALHTN